MTDPRPLSVLLVLALAAIAGARDECTDVAVRDPYACREVIVTVDPATFVLADLEARFQDLTSIGSIPQLDQFWFVEPETAIPDLIPQLMVEPGVLEAERNGKFVSPECRQWNAALLELGPDGERLFLTQPALELIGVSPSPMVGAGITVAVLDTGVSRTHAFLQGRLTTNGINLVGEGPPNPLAEERHDDVDNDLDGDIDEGWGHGTAIASLIAVVAPSVRILPVRVIDDECNGSAFEYAFGIVLAVDAGADVLNLSLGSQDHSSIIGKALDYAADRGVHIIAPGGNGGTRDLQFPARDSKVVAVAAVDNQLIAPTWTEFSSDIDFSAPGVEVYVATRDAYYSLSGTSFANAFVSAAVAAIRWARPTLDPDKMIRILEETATPVDDLNPDKDGELGAGVPNVHRAIRYGLRVRDGWGGPAVARPAEPPTGLGSVQQTTEPTHIGQ